MWLHVLICLTGTDAFPRILHGNPECGATLETKEAVLTLYSTSTLKNYTTVFIAPHIQKYILKTMKKISFSPCSMC